MIYGGKETLHTLFVKCCLCDANEMNYAWYYLFIIVIIIIIPRISVNPFSTWRLDVA